MDITEILETAEITEPETLRHVFPNFTSLDIQKIQVLWLLRNSRAAYEDMDVFENVVLILNGIEPNVSRMEGSTPEFIWKAMDIIKRINPDIEFADEIQQYIKFVFNDNGLWFYPPGSGLVTPMLNRVKRLAETGPFPLKETDIGIQTIRYLRIMEYLNRESK